MKRKQKQKGFTIVELLIVVVVIAVLAAITIVSYNGIANRAKSSAASSSLSQAVKKITLWTISNGDQLPATLSEAGITNSGSWTYEYRRFDTNTNYCISAVAGEASYYAQSPDLNTYIEGACSDVASIAGAGASLGQVVTQASPTTSFPVVTGTPDLIIYSVFDVYNADGFYNTIAAFTPASGTQRMQLDTAGTNDSSGRYRIDTSAAANASATQSNVRTSGRHIGWLMVRSGMTIREFGYDRAAVTNSSALNPGTGWSLTGLSLGAMNSSTGPVAAIAFNAAHDQTTRARVLQWLADSYNVPATY